MKKSEMSGYDVLDIIDTPEQRCDQCCPKELQDQQCPGLCSRCRLHRCFKRVLHIGIPGHLCWKCYVWDPDAAADGLDTPMKKSDYYYYYY